MKYRVGISYVIDEFKFHRHTFWYDIEAPNRGYAEWQAFLTATKVGKYFRVVSILEVKPDEENSRVEKQDLFEIRDSKGVKE